ncbi:uncharacterized protein LOC126856731 isoform X4 [Cataglyphis hispanica]|uniref:uncharacterized protein LOC126856731 isoform X4 n=1 Tax=Cataglyphis hispanica TaxID=1086592 RepID=UPI00217F8EDF|nr:uncharacterized protein LOC126856731 isoform X4 [Cataglyphis hispanica]
MVEIKISSSKDDDILTQDDAINLANLKLYTNVNVKNLKTNRKNVLFIICNVLIFLILIICFMISRIILITAQNEENTIRIYRTSEEVHRKIKDLEVRINNIMSRLKYNNQNIISTYPWRIRSIDYSKSFIREPANLSKIKNDRDSNTALVIFDVNNSTVPSAFVQSLTTMDRQNHVIEKNSSIFDIINPSIRSENNLITEPKMKDLLREKRAILKIEAQNHTMTKDVQSGNDTMDTSRESRARKLQRDEGRDPAVVTFVGAIPEQEFKNTGPWIKSSRSNGAYDFTKFYLAEENYSIEVTISGLYMISVQIFYFGKPINHSYWVLLNSEGSSMKQKLITCAIASVSTEGGSCYTSITTYLQKGDRLSIQQQERNRLVKLREGYSQVQLVLLANDKHRRGPRANIFYNEHLCSTRIHIFI